MKSKKYNEFNVLAGKLVKGEYKIEKKELTDRGHVMITDRDAEINNAQSQFTKLYYELAEVKTIGRPKKEE